MTTPGAPRGSGGASRRGADAPPHDGAVVWITGLPSSGKSVLARRIRDRLLAVGRVPAVLDGDELRALVPSLLFDDLSRTRFYEIVAQLAALLARQGLVVLVPATAHRRSLRRRARELAPRFVEVHVTTPLDVCEHRDPKGLYARSRAGEVLHLPGVGEPYEPPESPDVVAEGGGMDDRAAVKVLELLSGPAG
jgi:adenylylsulfate kinase